MILSLSLFGHEVRFSVLREDDVPKHRFEDHREFQKVFVGAER